ncbi:hypothetical protein CFREI_00935 [Corynebacterium freiburgense]|nr:hypothetical protein CFREI_00935 [Corynebacterium freiburgense]
MYCTGFGVCFVVCLWFSCVRPVTWDLVRGVGSGRARCHRFHFFGGFYGICDTIGREPVTDSIFFTVFMESATNPRSTLVRNMACCHKFHFFSRFYGICDSGDENITSSIGCAYQTAGKAQPATKKPTQTPRRASQCPWQSGRHVQEATGSQPVCRKTSLPAQN